MSFPWSGFGLILDCLSGTFMLPMLVVTGDILKRNLRDMLKHHLRDMLKHHLRDMLKHNLRAMLAHHLLLRGGGVFSHDLAGGMR